MGIASKLSAAVASIPDPVLGGLLVFCFANILLSGVHILGSGGASRRSFSLSHTYTLSICLSLTHTHRDTHTVCISFSLSLSLSGVHILGSGGASRRSLSHTHIHTLCLSLSLTHTHTHTLTHPLTPKKLLQSLARGGHRHRGCECSPGPRPHWSLPALNPAP